MAVNGRGRPTKEQAAQAKLVNDWLAHIASYEKVYKPWETRGDKIIKRYRDEDRDKTSLDGTAKFNILWANVQTLVPATYSKVPSPDVSRRFKDNDPVGRVAGMILERALDFEVQHYEDFRNTMTATVLDRFLAGRGTAWARYEPHVRAIAGQAVNGQEITEDVDEPNEELDYECAPTDYVHWKDFGHTLARTWEEVRGVWRKVYMAKQSVEERFGKEWAEKIPMDAQPEDYERKETSGEGDNLARACIYEIWDKETGKAYWLSKSLKQMVDEKDDPLGLEDFFPCPKPLYASLTNDSLVPIPDFALYQDQARQLDTLADRLDGLIEALQVKGVYDASVPEIARIFTEGRSGQMIPVKNWASFSEKNGIDGAIDLVELKPIYEALNACYEAIQQCLRIIYDITGLADIVRGQSEASETATAQRIKGQYASLRLNDMKQDVARFATSLFQLKAQVICGKFSADTLLKIAGVKQLSPEDQKLVPEAIALLLGERATNPEAEESPNPLRVFRIEVNADTMVQIDEQAEKEARVEFLQAVGGFLDNATKVAAQAGPATPILVPMIMQLLKFGVTGFKVGRQVEGMIDSTIDMLKKLAENPPPPPPNPEMLKVQAQKESDAARLQFEAQAGQLEDQRERVRMQMEDERNRRDIAAKAQFEQWKAEMEAQYEERENQRSESFERWKEELKADTAIIVAEIAASSKPEPGAGGDGGEDGAAAPAKPKRKSPLTAIAEAQADFMQKIGAQTEALLNAQGELSKGFKSYQDEQAQASAAPVEFQRGRDGKVGAVKRGNRTMPVRRGPDGRAVGIG